MLSVSCPHCQKVLKGKDDLVGRMVICPACKAEFEIPLSADWLSGIPANQPNSDSDPLDFLRVSPPIPPPVLPPIQAQPNQPPVAPSPTPQQPPQAPKLALSPILQQSQPKTPGQVLDAALAVVMRFIRASIHRWTFLDRKHRLLVACGGFVAVALLVFAIAKYKTVPPELATHPVAKHKTVPPVPPTQPTAKTPANERPDRVLDSDQLTVGDTGSIGCAYAEIIKVIDDRSCIVVPYATYNKSSYGSRGEQTAVYVYYEPQLPILLKGWPTAGKVTGQKEELGKTVFRVTGTEDVKKTDGSVIRIHVLELVK